eukprot:m.82714 g.82714  ORF g.82714 m.82714 type:complete len:70 (-) comp8674_c0_seq1:292-501(-)
MFVTHLSFFLVLESRDLFIHVHILFYIQPRVKPAVEKLLKRISVKYSSLSNGAFQINTGQFEIGALHRS